MVNGLFRRALFSSVVKVGGGRVGGREAVQKGGDAYSVV